MADVIADHGHNVTLFQPFHIAMKNLDGLVKSKNIEIINYYLDHYEELLKSEADNFSVLWDSHLFNNPVLSSFTMSKMFMEKFEKTDTQLYLDTNLHAELKSRKFDVAIAETFGAAPFYVTFIWKYEKGDAEFEKRLPKNVHFKKWIPQPALLSDKRMKVFVTHGGLGSTMEIAYTGKPALMVPIFGDRYQIARMLARHGGAVSQI
ncbi:Protein CBG08872 [Caenorhabditis briggsae]|uniref:glucuronosyltransferase n=1 Tax=Caenorhabditis briggsae TaxID=6238 RepID=A8X7L2_CAEBR|nr:Protein CBG08872 [Caenorhabditis briggsae]CAP28623.1 Protein CBG08872 [Caenorhabditis briggsae]